MIDTIDRELRERFANLEDRSDGSRWFEVVARAGDLEPRRRPRTWLAIAAALALAVVVAAPAVGLPAKIVRLFEEAQPAPQSVQTSFADFDRVVSANLAAPPREVLETPAAPDARATLWVAPTRSGGFCSLIKLRFPGGSTEGAGGECGPSPSSSGGLFEAHLFTVQADGSGLRRLKEAPSDVDNPGPSWIDARHILVTTALGELALVSSQTGRIERRIALPRAGTQPAPEAAALSPNRKELAYTECLNEDCSSTALTLITLRGRLVSRILGGRSAVWSPRGDLLYACCQEPSTLGHKSRILFVPAGGGTARPITPGSIQADSPAWIG
jgi:hypothetical protein